MEEYKWWEKPALPTAGNQKMPICVVKKDEPLLSIFVNSNLLVLGRQVSLKIWKQTVEQILSESAKEDFAVHVLAQARTL